MAERGYELSRQYQYGEEGIFTEKITIVVMNVAAFVCKFESFVTNAAIVVMNVAAFTENAAIVITRERMFWVTIAAFVS